MKIFKITLLIVVLVLIIVFVGIFFFIKTFDINKYRGQIVGQVSQLINREVEVGRMQLVFSTEQGLTLEADSLKIKDAAEFSDDYFVDIKKARLAVDLLTFISSQKLLVREVVLTAPKIHLVRLKDGRLNVPVVKSKEPEPSAKPWQLVGEAYADTPKGASKGAPFSIDPSQISVDTIHLIDGEIVFRDDSLAMIQPIVLLDFNLQVDHFSFEKPFKVNASGSFLSRKENIKAEAKVHMDTQGKQVRLDDVAVETDLEDIQTDELIKFMPLLQPLLAEEALLGKVRLSADPVIVGQEGGLLVLSFEGTLTDGRVKLKSLEFPIENIDVTLKATESDLTIKDISMNIASGKINLQGQSTEFLTKNNYNFKLNADALLLKDLLAPYALPVAVEGKLGGRFDIKGEGLKPDMIIKALQGEGVFEILEGKIVDFNLLRLVLSRISMLPDLVSRIEANLPEKYREILQKKDTALYQVEFKTSLRDGVAAVTKGMVDADGIILSTQGAIDLNQSVSFSGDVTIPADLSESMISAVPELAYLTNMKKEIQIPLRPYKGELAKMKIYPDLEYLGKKIIQTKGKEELKEAIFKALDIEPAKPSPAGTQPTTSAPQSTSENSQQPPTQRRPEEILIENVLDAILK